MQNQQSFIEVQFPVSKISKESYKERKANLGQTLTGLGKWWGRKPLILVRSAILGLLMPASNNPKKDREIFLKILTMDDEGLWIRKDKSIDTKTIYENLTPSERKEYFKESEESVTARNEAVSKNEITSPSVRNDKKISPKARQDLQKLVFNRLSYDEKLTYCKRPEEIDTSLSPLLPEERVRVRREHWQTINNHLNTNASNLQELIAELGKRKFGQTPIVGDCFCGGGSIPFEAGRIGCDVFASDLNPIALLLTYAGLNINGSSDEEIKKLKEFQQKIYDMADKQITEWGIEHNEKGHRANAYLYCNETICPECGYRVPLAPSWVIGKGTKTISVLGNGNLTGGTKGGFDIQIKSNSTNEEMEHAEKSATIQDSSLLCPNCKMKTTMISLRKDRKNKDGTMEYGLRKWTAHEFLPQKDDVFQERLYCIRYEDENGKRYYKAPDEEDLKREKKVLELLKQISSPFEGEDKGEGKRKKKVKERKEQKKESSIEKIINEAVKIAYDYLIPSGFDSFVWKTLIPEERFFIKCLDLEKSGIYQLSAYQELARGFGVKEYKEMLAGTKANQARLKTASELGTRGLSDTDRFGSSLLRNVLVAIYQSIKEENTIIGKNWLRNEVSNYWNQRNAIIEILDYLSTLEHIQNMDKWKQSAYYARILKELVKSDGV